VWARAWLGWTDAQWTHVFNICVRMYVFGDFDADTDVKHLRPLCTLSSVEFWRKHRWVTSSASNAVDDVADYSNICGYDLTSDYVNILQCT